MVENIVPKVKFHLGDSFEPILVKIAFKLTIYRFLNIALSNILEYSLNIPGWGKIVKYIRNVTNPEILMAYNV